MTRIPSLLFLFVLALAGCRQSSSEDTAAQDIKPTAAVQTVKLERRPISATATAYGSVIAQPGELESVSVQFESKVLRLLVSAGEPVEKGQPLIEIEPSTDAELAISEARTAAQSAQSQLKETKKRFDMRLAINSELQQAEQAAQDAAARLESLQQRGAGKRTTLQADLSGLVATIDVRMGQIVAAGAPLLSLVPEQKIEVRLGVEPEDAARLQVGDAVRLVAVHQDDKDVSGEIRLVTRRINPQTRLIDTFVTVPPDAPLLLDGYVRGEIVVDQKEALVVPRDAVLPGEKGSILFTVRDGRAVEHSVNTGIETDEETEVSGPDLNPGDEVVVQGNSQLEDGMAVSGDASK